jgi:hypothetical protein
MAGFIQIHERHLVATTSGTHHGEGVIGVLYENGSFELINAGQILSVSVGVHPKVKESLQREWSRSEKDSRGRPSTTNETHPIAAKIPQVEPDNQRVGAKNHGDVINCHVTSVRIRSVLSFAKSFFLAGSIIV